MSKTSTTSKSLESLGKTPRALLLAGLAEVAPQTAARFLLGGVLHDRTQRALSAALPEARRLRPAWYPEHDHGAA